MATGPQWKRVLISGSNLEVNHLTSSTALDPFKFANTARHLVFASDPGGHFQVTSSINNRHQTATNPNLFLLSESVNAPTNPISASTVANPVPVPTANPPLNTFPVVFKNEPHGGFETTSSIAFDPVLKFEGFQSGSDQASTNNNYIRTGSTLEGAGGTLPIDNGFLNMPGQTAANVPFTFTGSLATGFYTSQSELTYLDTSNGDFIEFKRAMPVGSGITASFEIPFFFKGTFVPNKDIKATLRRWQPGGYAAGGAAEFIDSNEIVIPITVFQNMNGWSGSTPLPVSASFSGSFEIDSLGNFPIQQGERFQLRVRAHQDYGLGYSTGSSTFYGGGPLFKISGSTAVVGDELTGNLSGSFAGNVFGDMSSSLYGVTLDGVGNITRGQGILLMDNTGGAITNFDGSTETTMSIRFGGMSTTGNSGGVNKAGLELTGISDSQLFNGGAASVDVVSPTKLQLATGLPQDGLSYGGSNKEQINIDFASNPGLTTTGGNLHIANTFPGSGLSGSFGGALDGSASINLNPSQSGLTTTQGIGTELNKLMLNVNLAGDGLEFNQSDPNDRSDLRIDTNFAVTGSGSITVARADSNPLSLQQSFSGGTLSGGNSRQVFYNNNNSVNNGALANVQLTLNSPFTEAYTFKNNLIISGNFRVLDSSNVTSINTPDFKTTDPFILLNSGSFLASPFNKETGGYIVQTSSYAQGGSGQASGSAIFTNMASSGMVINGKSFNKFGWGVTKGKVPWNALNVVPPFSTTTSTTQQVSASHVRTLSTVRLSGLGGTGDPGSGVESKTFYDEQTVDSLGAWYIDTGSTATSLGGESNVYLYGIFD